MKRKQGWGGALNKNGGSVWVFLPVCVYSYVQCCGDQKRALDNPGLELQMVVDYCMDAGN